MTHNSRLNINKRTCIFAYFLSLPSSLGVLSQNRFYITRLRVSFRTDTASKTLGSLETRVVVPITLSKKRTVLETREVSEEIKR